MQLIIESPRVQLNESLEELIRTKTSRLERVYNRITKCVIVLKKEKNDQDQWYCIEAILSVPQKQLFAIERADSFEAALQKVMDDLQRQLHRYKTERDEVR